MWRSGEQSLLLKKKKPVDAPVWPGLLLIFFSVALIFVTGLMLSYKTFSVTNPENVFAPLDPTRLPRSILLIARCIITGSLVFAALGCVMVGHALWRKFRRRRNPK